MHHGEQKLDFLLGLVKVLLLHALELQHLSRSFLNLYLFFSAELRKMGLKFETLIQDSGKSNFLTRVVDMSK